MPSLAWTEVPRLWQACFELAWEAHLEGSNPIGALVADADGVVVSTGKSAVKSTLSGVRISNCEIAHAEVNALLALDNRIHTKARASSYTLYATLEPCPVCFSALYMSDVKKLVYAAADRFGGSTNLLGKTPYLSRKSIQVQGPVTNLEQVSIFLNVYCDILRGVDVPDVVHGELARDYPAAVERALELAPEDSLAIAKQTEFAQVYDRICQALES